MKSLFANRNIPFIALFIVMFAFEACCTKKGCEEEPYKTVVFKNFPSKFLDSVWIYSYSASDNFTLPSDSTFVVPQKEYDSLHVLVLSQLRLDGPRVYKIIIPKVSKEYLITEMRFKKTKDCNACFPVRPRAAYYQKFVGYKINGVSKDGDLIEISF